MYSSSKVIGIKQIIVTIFVQISKFRTLFKNEIIITSELRDISIFTAV